MTVSSSKTAGTTIPSGGGGGGGTGTVTSIAVATANGFAATVTNATTTPTITLKTSLTGLLKGNGTALQVAVSGTDYEAPGAGAAAVATHVGLADPHPQYALDTDLAGYVPTTRTINAKPLSANVTLTAADVGAGDASGPASSVNSNIPLFNGTTGKLLKDSGFALGVGSEEMLANVTLGSAGTSLASGTITAKKFLRIEIYIAGYGGSDTASLQFNGSGGTAYRYQWMHTLAGALTFTAGNTAPSTDRIKVASVNMTNSRRVVAFVSNFATVTEKLVAFRSLSGTGSAATQATRDVGDGAWVSGAATQITSVSLISSSNMNAGTQMTIYGWN